LYYSRIIFLFLFLAGCRGISSAPASSFAQSKPVNTIAVVVFENTTEEPVLELRVSSALKEAFIRRVFSVIRDAREADFTLSGKIDHFENVFVSLNTAGQVSESRVTIGLAYKLLEKKSASAPLNAHLTASADYFNSADKAQDKANQDRAIQEASLQLAEKVADDLASLLTKI
jgi:hypothetical protein